MMDAKRFGIALSGGGYRAAGFHIGTLKKLDEMGILKKVDVMSTISGGSITGAAYCLHQGDFSSFEEKMIDSLSTKSVIQYVLKSWLFLRAAIPMVALFVASFVLPFTPWPRYAIVALLLLLFLIIRYQFKLLPLSQIIEKAYNEFFCQEASLSNLCDKPELAIGSTNLQTMRQFTFSKRKMEDSTYAYYPKPIFFKGAKFPVARAVMASSCVPFAFSPVCIDQQYFADQSLYSSIDPKLIDGGVYDNQGIHKITQLNSSYACGIILVSDAGNKLPFEKSYNNTFTLLMRTVDTFMVRIKNFQMMQNLYQNKSGLEIAYQSLGWDIEKCVPDFFDNLKNGNIPASVTAAHNIPANWLIEPQVFKEEIIAFMADACHLNTIIARALPREKLAAIRQIGTNLTRIKRSLINDMIIHSENLTEIQIRLYCPTLLLS